MEVQGSDFVNHFEVNMKTNQISLALFTLISSSLSLNVLAQEAEKEVQDMSDPLAVYTQAGMGVTNKGINLR